jgi:hypothetical protein
MEQLQELLNLLQKTPEMALWGAALYFLFILLKAASWISAGAFVLRLFITRYFDWKEKAASNSVRQSEMKAEAERLQLEAAQVKSMETQQRFANEVSLRKEYPLHSLVEKDTYDGGHDLHKLLLAIGDGKRCHSSDIQKVTQMVLKSKSPAK